MVKGRRKSRSKSSGDFNNQDDEEFEGTGGCWRRVNIAGEVRYHHLCGICKEKIHLRPSRSVQFYRTISSQVESIIDRIIMPLCEHTTSAPADMKINVC